MPQCSVEGCEGRVHGYGLCGKHYQRSYLFGRLSKKGDPEQLTPRGLHKANDGRRSHHQYSLWWGRKQAGVLCSEWDDFWKFVADVGEKPTEMHYFSAPDPTKPFGPRNFEWRQKLKRGDGETKKQFHARAWASRRQYHPSYEANRWLKRKYGISLDDLNRMKAEQNNVCAICHQPETSYDPKTHAIKGLSVDHCHTTKKVRGLLCFACNSAIGKLRENIELLDACRAYLVKHQGELT